MFAFNTPCMYSVAFEILDTEPQHLSVSFKKYNGCEIIQLVQFQ